MNQRYKQLIKAQKSKDPEDWKMCKELRNKVSREMKRAERNYWIKLLSEKENNKKDFWKVVWKMTNKDRKIKRTGPIKNEENELVYEDKKKAETMNIFQILEVSWQKNSQPKMQTFIHQVTPTIENITLTDEQFQNQFKKIHIHKAHGHDNKTSKEMKVIAEHFFLM